MNLTNISFIILRNITCAPEKTIKALKLQFNLKKTNECNISIIQINIEKYKYIYINNNNNICNSNIQGVPKLMLDILKADSLANLKTIFPQRKCRGTNSFRVIND